MNDSFGWRGDSDKIGSSATTWALSSSLCSPPQSVQGDPVSYLKYSLERFLTCLQRYWGQMSSLVKSLTDSITSITALLLLLSLSVFIAALLGIQLFSGKFPTGSRSNFDGMVASTLTVFQVIIQFYISSFSPSFFRF